MNFGAGQGLDGDKMASKFNSFAYGNVMAAAAENLKKEMLANERANAATVRRTRARTRVREPAHSAPRRPR